MDYTVIPFANLACRGRRAKRQSFYHRQRIARLLQRIVNAEAETWRASIERAYRDMLCTGFGAIEMRDSGDGEGFTARPIEPGEWPRTMLRTRSIEP